MFTRTLVLLFSLLGSGSLVANPGQQPTATSIAGRWEGAIDISGAVNLPFAVTFTNAAAGLSASIDIQGAKGLLLRAVSLEGQAVHFELPTQIGVATFEGMFDGTTISGSFVQGPAHGSFKLAREGAPKPAPVKRDVPYKEEDVTFKNGAVTLAGTLSIPEGKGPFPAFVMVTGSGLQNRDEELFGFKPFAVITDYLVRRGIATLRYDDRGAGGSTGSIAMATTADFADDALAGVALLASRPEIDHANIGVFGHSEGADVSAIAAAKAPDRIAFIIMMAGISIPGDAVLRYQAEDSARALGGTDEQVAHVLKAHRQVTDAVPRECAQRGRFRRLAHAHEGAARGAAGGGESRDRRRRCIHREIAAGRARAEPVAVVAVLRGLRSRRLPHEGEVPGVCDVRSERHAGAAESQSTAARSGTGKGGKYQADGEGVPGGQPPVHQGEHGPGDRVPDAGEGVRARRAGRSGKLGEERHTVTIGIKKPFIRDSRWLLS